MHVDTGQNFPAVIEFRDRIVADLGARSSSRRCRRRSTGAASSKRPRLAEDEAGFEATVRYRTVGDMSCTSGLRSRAATIEEVVAEIAATRVTERGETRADDRIGEAAMENRKCEGYFFR
jgi:3'-phosphoadenosine 5'-phosphosulfate sulfotransferase (PAPS reductase)/FAD synthetase